MNGGRGGRWLVLNDVFGFGLCLTGVTLGRVDRDKDSLLIDGGRKKRLDDVRGISVSVRLETAALLEAFRRNMLMELVNFGVS